MRRLRITVGVLCAVLFAVLTPLALTASWADSRIDDPEGYVDTVGDVVDEPEVRAEVASRLEEALASALGEGVPNAGPIIDAAVDDVLGSDEFASGWREANREAHQQIVAILRGDATAADGDVVVSLAGLYNAAADILRQEGINLAERPEGALQFRTAPPQRLQDAQSGYQALVGAGVWLPVVTIVLLVVGLALAPGRTRFTVGVVAAVGAVITSAILLAALAAGAEVAELQVQREDRDLAGAVIRVLLDSLAFRAWVVIGVGVVAAIALVVASLLVGRRRPAPGRPA